MQNPISFCDILSEYGEGYIKRNTIQGQEKGIIRLLSACRSSTLGAIMKSVTSAAIWERFTTLAVTVIVRFVSKKTSCNG